MIINCDIIIYGQYQSGVANWVITGLSEVGILHEAC